MAAVTIDPTQGASVMAPHDLGHTTKRLLCLLTGAASYATGGDTGVTAALGLNTIFVIAGQVATNGSKVYLLTYNQTTDAIQWWDPTTGAEVPNATNLVAYTALVEVIAK